MKSEKGKSVFSDDVDAILTEKIVGHTKKNITDGDREENGASSFEPPQRNKYRMNISKSKCITMCLVLALLVAGIIAFFIFKPTCCGNKKRKYPFFS